MKEAVTIHPFTPQDLQDLKPLQPPDWSDIVTSFQYYLAHPAFTFPIKAIREGRLAGIGSTVLHKEIAWLAHIIVHPDFRNRGIGSRITEYMIDFGRKTHETLSLLSTDMGYPVYAKLGFETECIYYFLKPEADRFDYAMNRNIVAFEKRHLPEVLKLDALASGEDRSYRLMEFVENGFVYEDKETVTGFYLPGFGEGLIVAEDDEAGFALMEFRRRDNLLAVVPEQNESALKQLESWGYRSYRKARKMTLGKKRSWHPAMIYNRVSGQIG